MSELAPFRWTDELVDEVRRRAAVGESGAAIADAIGAPTRSTVIGKAYRLGIQLLGRENQKKPENTVAPVRLKAREMTAKPSRPKPLPIEEAAALPVELTLPPRAFREIVADPAEPVALLDLQITSCRWPLGDPGRAGFGFCGKFRAFGATYCTAHAAIAYTSRDAQRLVERAR